MRCTREVPDFCNDYRSLYPQGSSSLNLTSKIGSSDLNEHTRVLFYNSVSNEIGTFLDEFFGENSEKRKYDDEIEQEIVGRILGAYTEHMAPITEQINRREEPETIMEVASFWTSVYQIGMDYGIVLEINEEKREEMCKMTTSPYALIHMIRTKLIVGVRTYFNKLDFKGVLNGLDDQLLAID
jgi:hypothetical protein